jgi:hypothetical protein
MPRVPGDGSIEVNSDARLTFKAGVLIGLIATVAAAGFTAGGVWFALNGKVNGVIHDLDGIDKRTTKDLVTINMRLDGIGRSVSRLCNAVRRTSSDLDVDCGEIALGTVATTAPATSAPRPPGSGAPSTSAPMTHAPDSATALPLR